MDTRAFETFGLPHCAAMAVTAIASIYMVWLNRSSSASPKSKHRANVILAFILIVAVSLDPILTWLRYDHNPDLAFRLVRETALPLYLCDVVSLVLAVALVTNRQRFAEMGYLWGIAGTVQGLITPTLYFSWDTIEYYAFFAQHGGVPVAALALAFGTKLSPQPGAFKRAVLWSWLYMIVVFGLNGLLGANYGFLNAKPKVGTLFDYMGPYPWCLVTLQFIAFTFYFLLLLPFRSRKQEVETSSEILIER
ncbi:MAG: TIGR02206 family membrane protein [Verrucomicrobiota bacterium]